MTALILFSLMHQFPCFSNRFGVYCKFDHLLLSKVNFSTYFFPDLDFCQCSSQELGSLRPPSRFAAPKIPKERKEKTARKKLFTLNRNSIIAEQQSISQNQCLPCSGGHFLRPHQSEYSGGVAALSLCVDCSLTNHAFAKLQLVVALRYVS